MVWTFKTLEEKKDHSEVLNTIVLTGMLENQCFKHCVIEYIVLNTVVLNKMFEKLATNDKVF